MLPGDNLGYFPNFPAIEWALLNLAFPAHVNNVDGWLRFSGRGTDAAPSTISVFRGFDFPIPNSLSPHYYLNVTLQLGDEAPNPLVAVVVVGNTISFTRVLAPGYHQRFVGVGLSAFSPHRGNDGPPSSQKAPATHGGCSLDISSN